jgi:hypothetical protein
LEKDHSKGAPAKKPATKGMAQHGGSQSCNMGRVA